MKGSLFLEWEFFLLVVTSIVFPVAIYVFLLKTRSISKSRVIIFASILILLSALDVFLLRSLSQMAKLSSSVLETSLFRSELSIALYLLPAVFGGIGVNLISHVLIQHLGQAERQFEREHPHVR